MSFTESFASTAQAVVELRLDPVGLPSRTDEALLAAHSVLTEHRRHADLVAAKLAGEIERRSSRDAGYSGLAQRKGFGSAGALLQTISPVTRAEAHQLVAAGTLMSSDSSTLWEAALSSALSSGSLPIAAADAIRAGLAPVADSARATDLLAECERLLERASSLSIDELRRESRSARDRLDEAGIARREKQRRDSRYLKRWVRQDGMYQGSFLLDPEGGQRVFSALDAIMSPRREVRFEDSTSQAEAGAADPRTDDQRLADAFVEMVRIAVDADPGTLFGSRRPAVRVVVTEKALSSPGGHGFFESDEHPVSRETVDRFICDTGYVGIRFDSAGQILDLGRTQRLFTERQRLAISVRDGGCLFPHCRKPPAHCEAHHITEWSRGGRTDAAEGVLLCRHHHMLLHDNHWQILRDRDRYWLKPPVTEDPSQTLLPLTSKSRLMPEA